MNPNRTILAPPSKNAAKEVWRAACIVGSEAYLSRIAKIYYAAGMSIQALSVPPLSRSNLNDRIYAQDMQDKMSGKLKVRKGLAPEVVHNSDEFKFLIANGPKFWLKDMCYESLLTGKHVMTYPIVNSFQLEDLIMLNNQPELNDLLCLTINDLRFFPGVRRLADIISQLKQDDGNDHFSTSNLHYDIKLGPPLFSATPILTNETKRLNSWFLKAQGGGAIGLSGIQAHDLIRYINNDVMEDDGNSSICNNNLTKLKTSFSSIENDSGTIPDSNNSPREITSNDICNIEYQFQNGNGGANIELKYVLF